MRSRFLRAVAGMAVGAGLAAASGMVSTCTTSPVDDGARSIPARLAPPEPRAPRAAFAEPPAVFRQISIASPAGRLVPFADRAALDAWLLRAVAARTEIEQARRRAAEAMDAERASLRLEALAIGAGDAALGSEVSGAVASLTNVQDAAVDEGDIVKAHGEHLVVLRRGRLFTLRLGARGPELVDRIDVPEDADAVAGDEAWYDELLVVGDTLVVTGYAYGGGGTEWRLFGIDRAGRLTRGATYDLRSDDYFSDRNYASRVVDGRLLAYVPSTVVVAGGPGARGTFVGSLPALRRAPAERWDDIVDATGVVGPIQPVGEAPVLHGILACEVGAGALSCRLRGVLGPPERTLFVAPDAAYLWLQDGAGAEHAWATEERTPLGAPHAVLYRIPLDGSPATAARVAGAPIDTLAFQLDEDGTLHVLARAEGRGDGMWGAERGAGDLAVLAIRPADLGAEARPLPSDRYFALPSVEGWAVHVRFVGDTLVYGVCGDGPGARRVVLHAVRAGRTYVLPVAHDVDRIERLGDRALVVGVQGLDLHLTTVTLDGTPRVAGELVEAGVVQGDTRTHGFSFHETSPEAGVLGLPIADAAAARAYDGPAGAAGVLFVRARLGRLARIGTLRARASTQTPEAWECLASCVDWYGDARPVFWRGRALALLGYELVEGRIDAASAQLGEHARVDFTPRAP